MNKKRGSKMKKRVVAGALILAMLAVFSGCGVQKLSDEFDENKVKEQAEQVIADINETDYDAVADMVLDDFKEKLSADTLKKAFEPIMTEAGKFEEYKTETVVGSTNKAIKGNLAQVVLIAKYEKKTVTCSISFNTDYKLVGIYIK